MKVRIVEYISMNLTLRKLRTLFGSTTHDVRRRFESAAFLSLTWAFWVALNWILS